MHTSKMDYGLGSQNACESTHKSRKGWLEAMYDENGFRLREFLRNEPCLLTSTCEGCSVLHLAIRKGWYGLVWEILRCFDHVLYDVGEVAVDPFISAIREEDGHSLSSVHNGDQATYASGSNQHTGKPTSASGFDEGRVLATLRWIPGRTNAEVETTKNASRRHNCLDLDRFRDLLTHREGKQGGGYDYITPGMAGEDKHAEKFYDSGLDVFGMLVVGGNIAMHVIIQEAYSRGMKKALFDKGNPYAGGSGRSAYRHGIMRATKRRDEREEGNQAKEKRHRALLRSIFEKIFRNDERRETLAEFLGESAKAWELESPFLPFEEYLFFRVCRHSVSDLRASLFQAIKETAQNVDFLEYLFTISGPCGTVFHFTEEECFKNDLLQVFKLMPIETQAKCLLIKDTRGRTPFFLACVRFTDFTSIDHEDSTVEGPPRAPWEILLSEAMIRKAVMQEEMTVGDHMHWRFGGWEWQVAINLKTVSEANGYAEEFRRKRTPVEEIICTPVLAEQRTVMLSCFKSVLQMVNRDIMKEVKISSDARYSLPGWGGDRLPSSVSYLGLTVLLRKRSILEILLKDDRFYDDGRLNRKEYDSSWREGRDYSKDVKDTWCASVLHVAAMQADPDVIRKVLRSRDFDPLIRDQESNTALHHAVRFLVPYRYELHITDIPLIPKEFIYLDAEYDQSEAASESRRQGCINLLLGAGLDIWDTNKVGEIADPGSEASPQYSAWWYEKVARETQESNARLNAAANAVSVTAALVATASFIGPLQPPLGYGAQADGLIDKMQVGIVTVRMFIVSNTLAFYFALGSIMLSLTPSLPVPQESVLDEFKLTRRTVTVALVSLILSIIAILVAFAASSIAVISDEGSWNHGGLTVSTLAIGGLWCMLVLVCCIMRAVRLIFHKSQSLRLLYRRWVYR